MAARWVVIAGLAAIGLTTATLSATAPASAQSSDSQLRFNPEAITDPTLRTRGRLLRRAVDNAKKACDVKALDNLRNGPVGNLATEHGGVSHFADPKMNTPRQEAARQLTILFAEVLRATERCKEEAEMKPVFDRIRALRRIVENAKKACDVETLDRLRNGELGDIFTTHGSVAHFPDPAKNSPRQEAARQLGQLFAEIIQATNDCDAKGKKQASTTPKTTPVRTATRTADPAPKGNPDPEPLLGQTFNVNFTAGGLFQTGSRNDAGSILNANGNFVGAVRGYDNNGGLFNLGLTTDLTVPGLSNTSITFDAYYGASFSTASTSKPGATAYQAYVDGNAAIGFGAVGKNATIKSDSETMGIDFSFMLDMIDFFMSTGRFARPLGVVPGSQLAAHDTAFLAQAPGSAGLKLTLFGGLGFTGRFTRSTDNITESLIDTAGVNAHTKLRASSLFFAPTFTFGARAESALGAGRIFGKLVGRIAPGVMTVNGRADQVINCAVCVNTLVNPMRSDRTSRGTVQTKITGVIGYTFGRFTLGLQGAWLFDANQAYMRMPVGDGTARLDFRPGHAFEVMAKVKIALP